MCVCVYVPSAEGPSGPGRRCSAMAAAVVSEQLQPDDLSVRGGRRPASVSPPPAGAEQESTPQAFSQLSRLLQPAAGAHQQAAAIESLGQAAPDAHTGRRFYECDVCRMRFTNGANLRRHRMRHTGFKPYECRSCSKRFFRRDHLLEHMSTHAKAAGRRLPWQCPVCGKGFQRQIAMRAHYQNEHVREGDWSGVCRLCGFGASSQQSLHAHLASQHGLQLGSAPSPSPQASSAAQLLPAPPHHFLAPLELRADAESPPGSPRPSQVSPHSSESSPHSSSQVSEGSAESVGPSPAAVKTEPPEDAGDRRPPEDQQEEEDGPASAALLLARRTPGLLPTNGERR